MAINDAFAKAQAAAPAAAPAVNPTTAQPAASQGWSFHAGGLFGAPIGKDLSSEYMTKLKTGLEEIYKNVDSSTEVQVVVLDPTNEPALVYSSIVVTLRIKDQPKLGVAYHVLICESTNEPLTPLLENINGQQVEILRVTSDALDNVLANKVKERVQRMYPGMTAYLVDACVVPRTFDPEDKRKLQQLALNAGMACKTELVMRTPGWSDFNLGMNQRDSTLVITQSFNHQQIEDAVGNPMRSDVLITFSSQKNKEQNQQSQGLVNTGDREAKVSEVSGFIDLVWAPVQPQAQMGYYAPVAVATQKYVARLVLTNLSSNFAYTPSSMLLSLGTAMTLRDDNNWMQHFRPRQTGRDVDLHDLGAMNIEANLAAEPTQFGTRINTKADTFRLEDMGRYIASLIQAGLLFSMDCPENGPQSWYTSMFAAASAGSAAAYDAIYEAAQDLTNGAFGRHFVKGTPMFIDVGNRVHLGTWVDANGVKRDIRDIDTVAVANLIGERDPQVIREWSDTFLRVDYPLAQRLAARKKIIAGLTNHSAVFTGFAQRVTFSTAFLDALSKGIRELAIPVRVVTPLSASSFNDSRGVAGFVQQGLLAPGVSFMPATAGYQPQFAQGYANQYRW